MFWIWSGEKRGQSEEGGYTGSPSAILKWCPINVVNYPFLSSHLLANKVLQFLCSAPFVSVMIVHGKHSRMFFSWLRHIFKTTAFRLNTYLLRLIRHCQSVVNGRKEGFQERPGGLALSSQPVTEQPKPTPPASLTLAVPLLEAPLHDQGSPPGTDVNVQMPTPKFHGWSNDAAFEADFPSHSFAPSMPSSIPGPSISMVVTTPSAPAVSDQIFLAPIVPQQVNRYGRNVRVYVNCVSSELPC